MMIHIASNFLSNIIFNSAAPFIHAHPGATSSSSENSTRIEESADKIERDKRSNEEMIKGNGRQKQQICKLLHFFL